MPSHGHGGQVLLGPLVALQPSHEFDEFAEADRVQSVYFETQTDSGWVSGPIEEVACGRPQIVVRSGDTWPDSIGFGGCYRRPNCFTNWVAESTSARMRVFLSVYRVEKNSRLSNVPVHDVVSNPFVVNLVLPP